LRSVFDAAPDEARVGIPHQGPGIFRRPAVRQIAYALKSLSIPEPETRGYRHHRVTSPLEGSAAAAPVSPPMNAFHLVLTLLVHSVRALGRSRADLVLENVALRQQIAVLTRTRCVPRWQAEERLLWVALRRAWRRWQDALVIVQPETVGAWHRKAFGRYWTAISRRPRRSFSLRKLAMSSPTTAPRQMCRWEVRPSSGVQFVRSQNHHPKGTTASVPVPKQAR
jgi:hypothetical protein